MSGNARSDDIEPAFQPKADVARRGWNVPLGQERTHAPQQTAQTERPPHGGLSEIPSGVLIRGLKHQRPTCSSVATSRADPPLAKIRPGWPAPTSPSIESRRAMRRTILGGGLGIG